MFWISVFVLTRASGKVGIFIRLPVWQKCEERSHLYSQSYAFWEGPFQIYHRAFKSLQGKVSTGSKLFKSLIKQRWKISYKLLPRFTGILYSASPALRGEDKGGGKKQIWQGIACRAFVALPLIPSHFV